MTQMSALSWNKVEIDLAALRHNFRQVAELVGNAVEILAVVKADAYGHGLVPAAQAFAQAGAAVFGVAELEEGIRLRQAGINGQIVVMLGVDRHGTADAVTHALTPVVYDLGMAQSLSQAAVKAGRCMGVQVKVDVGMSRLGVLPRDFPSFMASLAALPNLYVAGVLSHFPKSDVEGDRATESQSTAFATLLDALPGSPGQGAFRHIANSATLLRYPSLRCDMVRSGISLYGCYPADWLGRNFPLALRPAMRFTSQVIQIKEVPVGQGISYGHAYVTDRPTRLAILPVGYDNGYLRRLAGKAEVLLGGQRAPIRGMICMNACMADITDIPSVKQGDEAVLLGCQGSEEISADEVARWSETINYEILCLLGACNRQTYIDTENDEKFFCLKKMN